MVYKKRKEYKTATKTVENEVDGLVYVNKNVSDIVKNCENKSDVLEIRAFRNASAKTD